jgi:hypothetical protein
MRSRKEIQAKLEQARQLRRSNLAAQGWCEALEWLGADTEEAPELPVLPEPPPTLEQDEEKLNRYLSLRSILEQARQTMPDHPSLKAVEGWLGEMPELDPLELLAECDRFVFQQRYNNIPLPEVFQRWLSDRRSLEAFPMTARYILAGRWSEVLEEFVQRLGIQHPWAALPLEKLPELRKEATLYNIPAMMHVLAIAKEVEAETGEKYYF